MTLYVSESMQNYLFCFVHSIPLRYLPDLADPNCRDECTFLVWSFYMECGKVLDTQQ
jgi:hypothetical protein